MSQKKGIISYIIIIHSKNKTTNNFIGKYTHTPTNWVFLDLYEGFPLLFLLQHIGDVRIGKTHFFIRTHARSCVCARVRRVATHDSPRAAFRLQCVHPYIQQGSLFSNASMAISCKF